jgi:hypothetical protein
MVLYHEDGGDTFFRNVDKLVDYTVSQQEDHNPQVVSALPLFLYSCKTKVTEYHCRHYTSLLSLQFKQTHNGSSLAGANKISIVSKRN